MFAFVYMQAHQSTCRSSGSKRPSLSFLPSATHPRHQRLAFTWSLGKNRLPPGSLWYVCAVCWSRQRGFPCWTSGVFPSWSSSYNYIPKKLHCNCSDKMYFQAKFMHRCAQRNHSRLAGTKCLLIADVFRTVIHQLLAAGEVSIGMGLQDLPASATRYRDAIYREGSCWGCFVLPIMHTEICLLRVLRLAAL